MTSTLLSQIIAVTSDFILMTMRFPTILLLLLLLLGLQCNADQQNTSAAERQDDPMAFNAEEVVGEWVTMWNTYDLSQVDSLFLMDERLTYFSSEKEGLITGPEAVREHHVGFGFVAGGKEQANRLWVEELKSQSFEAVTTVEGIWYFESVSEDSSRIQRGPVTFVYIASDDRHRIVHVHFANYEE